MGKRADKHPRYKEAVEAAQTFDAGWIRTFQDVEAVLDGCYMEESAGLRVCNWIEEFCRQSKGKWGKKLIKLMDWQMYDFVMPLFGWMREDGTRRFRSCHVEVPKKNGKSTLLAAICNYLIGFDNEPGAEVYCLATKIEQAAIIHNEALRMIEKSPDLAAIYRTVKHKHEIHYDANDAIFKAIPADAAGIEGANPHAIVIDELHVMKDPAMYNAVVYGGSARAQPLIMAITTAGLYDTSSVGHIRHTISSRIHDGSVVNWEALVYIAAAPKDAVWTDKETRKRANPAYNITVLESKFKTDLNDAVQNLGDQNNFRRYRLNQWVSSVTRWLDMSHWEECPTFESLEELMAEGVKACWIGVDASVCQDLTCIVCAGWLKRKNVPCRWCEDGKDKDGKECEYCGGSGIIKEVNYLWEFPMFWLPAEGIDKRSSDEGVPYNHWAQQGYIKLIPGPEIDTDYLLEYIGQVQRKGMKITQGGFDRAFCEGFTKHIEAGKGAFEGSPRIKPVEMLVVMQNYNGMTEPIKIIEGRLASRRILRGVNPVMDWCMGGAEERNDGAQRRTLVKPSRRNSNQRIDGAVAFCIAVHRAITDESKTSVYETQEFKEF